VERFLDPPAWTQQAVGDLPVGEAVGADVDVGLHLAHRLHLDLPLIGR